MRLDSKEVERILSGYHECRIYEKGGQLPPLSSGREGSCGKLVGPVDISVEVWRCPGEKTVDF